MSFSPNDNPLSRRALLHGGAMLGAAGAGLALAPSQALAFSSASSVIRLGDSPLFQGHSGEVFDFTKDFFDNIRREAVIPNFKAWFEAAGQRIRAAIQATAEAFADFSRRSYEFIQERWSQVREVLALAVNRGPMATFLCPGALEKTLCISSNGIIIEMPTTMVVASHVLMARLQSRFDAWQLNQMFMPVRTELWTYRPALDGQQIEAAAFKTHSGFVWMSKGECHTDLGVGHLFGVKAGARNIPPLLLAA